MVGIILFIVMTIVLIFAQGWLYYYWGLSRIEYTRSFSPKRAEIGETVEMVEEVSNRKLLPVPWLRFESKMPNSFDFQDAVDAQLHGEHIHHSVFSLMPFQKIIRRHRFVPQRRGYFWFRKVGVSVGDPFGYKSRYQPLTTWAEVVVYPERIGIRNIPLPAHRWQGDMIVRRWIVHDPFFIAGSREYLPGDSMNAINWKATARTGTLQVHKWDYTADQRLVIMLNVDTVEDIWMPVTNHALMETAITYAASIVEYALAQGVETGFGSNLALEEARLEASLEKQPKRHPVRVDPQPGKAQFEHIMEMMARLSTHRTMNFHQFLEETVEDVQERMDYLIITSIMTDKMQQQLDRLQARGDAVEVMMIDDEKVQVLDAHASDQAPEGAVANAQ